MLTTVHHVLTTLARWLAYVGVACLFGAMAMTVVDVLLRAFSRLINLFAADPIGVAITGVVDIVQLLVMAVAFLAIPFAFLRDAHVSVDLVTTHLPTRFESFCKALAAILAVGFMWIVLTTGITEAENQMAFGDKTLTIGIPYSWFWLPLLVGVASSIAATALLAVGHLGHAIGGGAPFGSPGHFPELHPEED